MTAPPSLHHDIPVYPSPDRISWQEQQSSRHHSPVLPKNIIRFKCVDCGGPMEARLQDGGVDTNCPHCTGPITVPRIPTNPFLRPINTIVRQMNAVPFPFPYLPQFIQVAVLAGVLTLFASLFITIGLVSQVAGVLKGLILDARKHLRQGPAVERSAQVINIGICSLLFLPFWLIQLPFSLIGSLWSSRRSGALLIIVLVLSIVYAFTLHSSQIIRLLQSF